MAILAESAKKAKLALGTYDAVIARLADGTYDAVTAKLAVPA
jgi:hypothetical protein